MWLQKRVGNAKDRCTGWLSRALILLFKEKLKILYFKRRRRKRRK